jgi:hypothetical protein
MENTDSQLEEVDPLGTSAPDESNALVPEVQGQGIKIMCPNCARVLPLPVAYHLKSGDKIEVHANAIVALCGVAKRIYSCPNKQWGNPNTRLDHEDGMHVVQVQPPSDEKRGPMQVKPVSPEHYSVEHALQDM